MALKIETDEFKKLVQSAKSWKHCYDIFAERGIKDPRSIRRRSKRLGIRPGIQHDFEIEDGFKYKGSTTLVDPRTGEQKLQWIKLSEDKERQFELLKAAADVLIEKVKGKAGTYPVPELDLEKDLLSVYPMPEPHMGLYSWGSENGGDDYDCDIAEHILINGMERLVDAAPASEEAVIVDIGDWYHVDNLINKTPRGGNNLDVDSRLPRVFQIGARVEKHLIRQALRKHKKVYVKKVPGNHDEITSFLLSMLLAEHFSSEPRVEVDLGVNPFKYHVFGNNLIGICHGEDTKADKLPLLLAADRPEEWGESTHRFWITGHIHHETKKEFPGCTVETIRTVAARDSWTHRKGYRSKREMQMIVYKREGGVKERHMVDIQDIKSEAA